VRCGPILVTTLGEVVLCADGLHSGEREALCAASTVSPS
jgi:hypothetical protein